MRHPVGQRVGLARAGPGDDQQRPGVTAAVPRRLDLCGVQRAEMGRRTGPAVARSRDVRLRSVGRDRPGCVRDTVHAAPHRRAVWQHRAGEQRAKATSRATSGVRGGASSWARPPAGHPGHGHPPLGLAGADDVQSSGRGVPRTRRPGKGARMDPVATPRPLRWETLTKKQFDAIDRREAVVLVTCSPLEVHGPHLPLGADALEGEGLAEHLLRFLPERHRRRTFLELPFIYAATDTVPQPGSLYFRPSTTIRVLEDLGRTLAAQGFRHVMVSNFHGGPRHFVAIEKACHRVHRRYGLRMASIFSLLISRLTNGSSSLEDVLGGIPGVHAPDLDGDTHGGLVETSQLLALHGEWVDPDYERLPRRTADVWLAERGDAPHAGDSGRAGGIRGLIRMLRH
ncbi:MAG TPA: hypothetical protein ENO23_10975, partial [Alphaproteobacteria bacterium]|nr:hypothetical protein [Alphaproteobacteria bacterium]